jgi:hypothetical protein
MIAEKSRTSENPMNEENIQPRRGRPRLGADEGKRYTIAIRTTKDLRDRLKGASEVSGRSLAREIERRLDQSFDNQEGVETAINVGIEVGFLISEVLAALDHGRTRPDVSKAPDFARVIRALKAFRKIESSQGPERLARFSTMLTALVGRDWEAGC